jgi:hypothetical protein
MAVIITDGQVNLFRMKIVYSNDFHALPLTTVILSVDKPVRADTACVI